MKRLKTDWRHAEDVRRKIAFDEYVPANPEIDYRVSTNVGEIMEAALAAAGSIAIVIGGRCACMTDYLAAAGAKFPEVEMSELERFNDETMFDEMDEEREFERYRRIARFFRRSV